MEIYDVLVIGSGPAGLTAAIYATRSNLRTFVIGGVEAGGQLLLTTDVEDFPGFPEVIQGPELIMRIRQQAERLGAEVINENVTKTDFSQKPFKVFVGEKGYQSKSVIIATGASAIWLGLPSEQKLVGKGVSSCAVCDGPFFRGKKVAVVGGGDTAMREAIFLSKVAAEVSVIHRRDRLRAFQALQDQAFSKPNVKFIWNSVVEEVLGENKVEGVKIRDVKTSQVNQLPIDGLFIAIGHKPNTEFLKGQVDLDEKGYIKIKNKQSLRSGELEKLKMKNGEQDVSNKQFSTRTSVEGVFAAGDVHDYRYQQAVTAAGAGCAAAVDAEEFLEEEKTKESVKEKQAR